MATLHVGIFGVWMAFSLSKAASYVLVEQSLSSDAASTYCQDTYGTYLTSIHSESDNQEASALCKMKPSCANNGCLKYLMSCHIGLNDKTNERDDLRDNWVWSDGSSYDYENWKVGEPNDNANSVDEDCVIIYPINHIDNAFSTMWGDISCTEHELYFLCNTPTTNHPTHYPSIHPTLTPSMNPTASPSSHPSIQPTMIPSQQPTITPTGQPTMNPSFNPSINPTSHPLTDVPVTEDHPANPSTAQPSVPFGEAEAGITTHYTEGTDGNQQREVGGPISALSYALIVNVVMAVIVCCMLGVCMYRWFRYQQTQTALSEARIAMTSMSDKESTKQQNADPNAAAPAANLMQYNNNDNTFDMNAIYGGMSVADPM
eukprot:82035_1